MADESQAKQPAKKQTIIIKKIIAGGHGGHHGGAWKVAYADFVTAMMAFFLLLWLLNATPSEKLKGIAQYFEPTVGIAGQKGIGFEGGRAQTKDGLSNYDRQQGVIYGVIQKGNIVSNPKTGTEVNNEEIENEHFSVMEGELKKIMASDIESSELQNSIQMAETPEGLVIKLIDQDKYPMFQPTSTDLQPYAKNILSKIAKLIKYSPNFLSISGHTSSSVLVSNNAQYSNWELSADRANAARRFMIEEGITKDQFASVVAKADTEPLNPDNPYAAPNSRINIVLLRNSIMPFNKISAPKNLITTPARENFNNASNQDNEIVGPR